MTTTNNIRYFYLRSMPTRQIAACIAYRLAPGANGASTMTYGIATVHPGDVVSKGLARTISNGRLEKHPRELEIPSDVKTIDVLVQSIAGHYRDVATLTASELRRYDLELQDLHLSREAVHLAHNYITTNP